jgi:hypothetical protein
LSLFRLKDSAYWWYAFYFDGKRYRKSTKKTKKTAAAVVEAGLLACLQQGDAIELGGMKPPVLRDVGVRFLEWVDNTQQLTPNGKKYYRYGWRLLRLSRLAGMRIDHISQDVAESIVFVRPLLNRKKKDREGRYEETKETVTCMGHYTNQALRTLKRMQNKAVEWKLLRDVPKFRLSKAPGRDRMIDERAEDELEQAYLDRSNMAGSNGSGSRPGWSWSFCRTAACDRTRSFPCGSRISTGIRTASGSGGQDR